MSLTSFMLVAPYCVCTVLTQRKLLMQTHRHRLDKYAHHLCFVFFLHFILHITNVHLYKCVRHIYS